ncbi:DVU_1556 family methyltransferase [Citrifermentans pelophilum]|nr:class I SAM-dependent methyltransferase [Geoanaerobacter pelophilus]
MFCAGQQQYEAGPLREITGPAIRPGGTLLTGRAIRFCSFAPGSELLDVGCGTGATVEYLSNRHHLNAVGIDPSLRLLEEGWERNPGLPLGLGTAEKLPAGTESKDGIICECVLSLLAHPERALAEFYRVLRHGGFLILSDLFARIPADNSPVGGLLSRAELEEMLSASGFHLLLWEDHSRLLRELAARLVFAHGSSADFWRTAGNCADGQRPGYYLLIAAKANREDA